MCWQRANDGVVGVRGTSAFHPRSMQTHVCEVWLFKVFVPELAAHAPRLRLSEPSRTLGMKDSEITAEIEHHAPIFFTSRQSSGALRRLTLGVLSCQGLPKS